MTLLKNKAPAWTERLLAWFDRHKRPLPWRADKNPYYIWVSEVMSQQTKIEAMRPYFVNWISLFPTLADVAASTEDEVVHAWQGLGYYSRARNLRLGMQQVMMGYGGEIPRDRKELESLRGIGSYTAGAILSIAFNQREAAVDGNVLRVYARLFDCHDDILKTKGRKKITAWVEETLPYDRPGDFNEALMDLGATICIPKTPRCGDCPLCDDCESHRAGTAAELPVRIPTTKVQELALTVGLVRCGDAYVVVKRPKAGLLRNMWEFLTVEHPVGVPYDAAVQAEGLKQLTAQLAAGGFSVTWDDMPCTTLTHVFSHRKWHMHVFYGEAACTSASLAAQWNHIDGRPVQWQERESFSSLVWAGPHGKLTVFAGKEEA